MSLIRWRNKPNGSQAGLPAWPVNTMRSEIDRLFDRFMIDPWNGTSAYGSGGTDFDWMPSLDVVDKEGELTVRAEIPGVETDDIQVTVTGNMLTIAGEKSQTTERTDENYYHSERRFGQFRRSIELPTTIDPTRISAEASNGVLTIHAPKLATARPRQVEVKPSTTVSQQPKRVPVGAT